MIFPTFCRQGYFLRPQLVEKSSDGHIFCGEHNISGAQCPNCAKPLLRFISLNLQAVPFPIDYTIPMAHLLYCWSCHISQAPFTYQILSEQAIHILEYCPGGLISNFPYVNYPEYFPEASLSLIPLSEDEQRVIKLINDEDLNYYKYENGCYEYLGVPQHQVGGIPILMQADRWQNWITKCCPICGEIMPFFSTIGDACLDSRGFTMDPYVEVVFHRCHRCNVFTAYNLCD